MLNQEIVTLLASIHPLDLLADDELSELGDAALDYFPRGTTILGQGGAASEYLYVIKRGTVRMTLCTEDGHEVVLDYRSEGEYFGLISVVSGDSPRANVLAEEDVIGILIPRKRLLEVLERNREVSDKLLRSYFIDFIDKAYDETRRKFHSVSNNHRILFATPVGELIRRGPITAPADATIQEGSQLMVEEGISSVVVVDGNGSPVGIVTDRDMREKVVARNRDPREPIKTIMTTPLIHVESREPCSEVLLKMMRHNIHHILVMDGDRFEGMVTNHDFMVLQGTSPTLLVRKVIESQSLEHLGESKSRLERTVAILSGEGAQAHHVTSVITEVSEQLLKQALSLIDINLGPAPVRYSLITTGQMARRELSLHRRLELGAVLEESGARGASAEETRRYFTRLSKLLGQALGACGIVAPDPCVPPERIRTPAEWIDRLDNWVEQPAAGRPRPGILEMRTVSGDSTRVEQLRLSLLRRVASEQRLLQALVGAALANRPPLGFLGRFVVNTEGEHRDELDLYESGIRPFVDVVRVLACESGIEQRQTRERLLKLGERHAFELAADVESALDYLQTLRIHQQLAHLAEGREAEDYLNPEELQRRERKTLKGAFLLTTGLHDELARRHPEWAGTARIR